MTLRLLAMVCGTAAILAGCSRDDPRLLNLSSQGPGPDEFSVLPTQPLEIPEDLAALPEPIPGGPNRVDPDPEAAAIAALGGNIDRAASGAGILGYATRFGIEDGIRATLAAEDLAFRQRNDGRVLERLFSVTVYFEAYQSQSLDQYAELLRMRAAGIRTPAVPPEDAE